MSYTLMLKGIRKEKKITQGELATLIGSTERVVGAWERQETQITLEDACRVCDALGCTPNDLCGWYLEHPEDAPGEAPSPDLGEARMVSAYRNMSEEGREAAANVVAGMAPAYPQKDSEHEVGAGQERLSA